MQLILLLIKKKYFFWIAYMVTRFRFWFYLKDSLFEGFKLAKNADPDNYVYSGYGIGFDSR